MKTTTKKPKKIKYTIELETTQKDVDNLIWSAFGGSGIGYWAKGVDVRRGGWVITEADGTKHLFSRQIMLDGFSVAAKEAPNALACWLEKNWDGPTADVLVQCAIFGKIVYE